MGNDLESVAELEAIIVRRLVTRLKVEDWYTIHGSEAAHPVEGPVVIVGLPRSGTTAMQYLLGLDPQFRYTRTWEMADPVPPPDLATERRDPRRRMWADRTGDVRHIATTDGPTEDGAIFGLHFHHQEIALPTPTYTAWWRRADHRSAFTYHERVLRLLHSRRPPQYWLLKAPAYLFYLRDFAAHYPGARFVMTHRDPAAAIPSACSVVEAARRLLVPSWSSDPATLGGEVLEHFFDGIQQAAADRVVLGEERFIDVGQKELEADGVGAVKRIYDFLGLRLTDQVRDAMSRWVVDNRRGSRGEHRYSPEQYGLTTQQIVETFRPYAERFGPFCS
jgi:Sulfotransferase family